MFLVDSFVAGASKTEEEFSQAFITKIEILGRIMRVKDFKTQQNKINMQKYPIKTLTSKNTEVSRSYNTTLASYSY